MSSQTKSEFGSIGARTAARAEKRHVEVESSGSWRAGVLVAWQRVDDGWWAEAAWVEDDALYVRLVPAGRVRPLSDAAPR